MFNGVDATTDGTHLQTKRRSRHQSAESQSQFINQNFQCENPVFNKLYELHTHMNYRNLTLGIHLHF